MNVKIIKYEPHDCEYTMTLSTLYEHSHLLTRHDDSEDWVEVDIEHCIAEGINHYEVYKHFGREKWYVDFLFDYAHNVEICEDLLRKTNEEVSNGKE